jgi:hypothetical protein
MRYTEVVGNEPTRAVSQPRWPRVDTRPRSDTRVRLDTAYFGLFYDEAMSNAASPPDGLVVLDFTHTLAGARGPRFQGSDSAYFVGLSLAIDLKTPEGAPVPVR